MATKIQFRRDTAANWSSANTVLSQGELGLDLTNNILKIGDGSTAWNSLTAASTTEAYVNAQIAALVGSAPATLDTLKELSDALGADENFAGTMTTALSGKMASVPGGTSGQVLTNVSSGVGTWQAVAAGGGIETKNIDSSTTYTLSNADKGKSLYVNNNTFNTINLPNPSTLDSDFCCYVHTTENVQDGYGNSGEIGIDPQYSTTSKRINGTSAAWTMYPDQFGLLTIDPSAAGWTFSVQNTGMDLRINGTLNWGSASAAGWAGIAMGGQSSAGGTHSMGLGVNANASANESTALGYYAQATGNTSVALANSKAGGTNSFAAAIGNNSSSYGASGTSSTAIGINAKAYSNYAVAIGWAAQAGNRACTFGGYNSIAGDNAGCLNTYSSSIVNAYSTGVGGLYASDHSIQGRFVLASADSLGGLGASQTSHYMVTGVTTNATQYTITGNSATTINGGNLMKIAPKSASTFSINIVAKQQGTSTNTAAWKIEGLIRQEANAAATTLVSSNLTVISNVPGWGDPVVVANTAHGALEVKVTGAASTNIKWGATIWSTEIIYT